MVEFSDFTLSDDVKRLNGLAGTVNKNLIVGNKYGAIRTWSEVCQRTFDSKAEARRGEELALLEKYGKIRSLTYQVQFYLCESPRVKTITIDFSYLQDGKRIYEDTKGVLTRDFDTKLLWLFQLKGIEVILTK